MNLKGTKTEKNLEEALAGESMARNKYDWFSSRAKKDGFEEIAEIFSLTALNEKEHAKLWFKHLEGGSVKDTYNNLLAAAAGEKGEYTEMYKRMAKEAREEGFEEIAKQFDGVANIEHEHEKRYLEYAKKIKENTVFSAEENTVWVCRNCGHHFVGKVPPTECPVCAHPQGYFETIKR